MKIGKYIDLQKTLYYLIILLLPSQLGKHFWPNFSYVQGIRIDYLSPTIYLTDVLILILVISVVLSKLRKFRFKKTQLNLKLKVFIAFTLFLLIGIVNSKNPAAGFYGLIKIFELVFFGVYTAKNLSKFNLSTIAILFSLSMILEGILSIVQYFNHGSIGGIFYYFGERTFNGQTPGIANASINGELILRPYGTFPHPNVLAGYLLIGITIIISNIKNQISKKGEILMIIAVMMGSLGLLLTMSRVAVVLWLLMILWILIRQIKNKNNALLTIFAFCILVLTFFKSPLPYRFINTDLSSESFIQRKDLIESSLAMIKDNYFVGTGLNNFLVNLPYYKNQMTYSINYLQPVHNIYLLIGSQTGFIGLFSFLVFICLTYIKIKSQKSKVKKENYLLHNTKYITLTTVLIIGLFDHYFLTIQQEQLLLAFIFGLCWANQESRKNLNS